MSINERFGAVHTGDAQRDRASYDAARAMPLFIGDHRVVIKHPEQQDRCIKVIKSPDVAREIKERYGIDDLNKAEYDFINSLPSELKTYLPENIELIELPDGNNGLAADRCVDFNGEFSRTVKELQKVNNPLFWNHIKVIADLLVKYDLPIFHLFQEGENIVCRKLDEEEWKPVLIDLKPFGIKRYPFQPWLRFRKKRADKTMRRLERFTRTFKG